MQDGLLDRILEISSLLQHDMKRAFAGTSLTESRVHLLWVLQHSGPSTQQTLAEALHVTPRTVSALVDGLATSRYVQRRPHPTDRRAVLVTLTEEAEHMMSTMAADHARLTTDLENVIDEGDRPAFIRNLDAVVRRLRRLVQEDEVRYDTLEGSTPNLDEDSTA